MLPPCAEKVSYLLFSPKIFGNPRKHLKIVFTSSSVAAKGFDIYKPISCVSYLMRDDKQII
jgi:hypothetical protein